MSPAPAPEPAARSTTRLAGPLRARAAFAGGATALRWAPVGVVALTLAVLTGVLGLGFVEWDDTTLLVDNPGHRPLGRAALHHAFTTTRLGHYAPLAWLSFSLDLTLWGPGSRGYHLTNLLLHAANAGLFYALAAALLGRAAPLDPTARRLGAAVAALVFALHPLRVEAVAWVTERRGVLSGFFVLLAVLAYLRAVGGPRRRAWLAASVGAFLFALLAKGSVLVLPVGLLVLDVYPLRRWPPPDGASRLAALGPLVREKLAHLVLAGAWVPVIQWSTAFGATVVRLEPSTWAGLVVQGLWQPLHKTLVPLRLSPLYEFTGRVELTEPRTVVAGIVVVACTALAIVLRRAWPAGLAAWTWHVVALAPFLAPAHAGQQLTADRYSYLASWGWALALGGAAALVVGRVRDRPVRAVGAAALGAALVAALAMATMRQVRVWEHRGTLWLHAVAVTPECATCRYNLGTWLLDHNRPAEALAHFDLARRQYPGQARFENAAGLALARLGRVVEAEAPLRRAVALAPGPEGVLYRLNLAGVLVEQRRLGEGVREVRAAVRGWEPGAALAHLQRSVEWAPRKAVLRLALAELHRARGDARAESVERAALAALDDELARVAAAPPAPGDGAR